MIALRARSAPASAARPVPVPAGAGLAFVLGHALLPLGVLALLLGTFVWGPFLTLGLAAVGGRLLTRVA